MYTLLESHQYNRNKVAATFHNMLQKQPVQPHTHAAPKHQQPTRCMRVRSARHKDLVERSKDPFSPAEVKDRPNLEADVCYRRVDNSAELAAEARYAFAAGLAVGEAGLCLARQALLIAAEDDAIASSSVVRFPVDAFMSRVQRLAADTAAALAAAAPAAHGASSSQQQQPPAGSSSSSQWASIRALPPSEVIAAVQHTLFEPQQHQGSSGPVSAACWYDSIRCIGFRVPAYGRSNLPKQSMLDHPGVWEDARMAYLNEVLVRKRGSAAALVILLCEVYRQLLMMGAIDFAVTFDYGDFNSLPVAQPLPNLTLQQLLLTPTTTTTTTSSAQEVAGRSSSYVSNNQTQQLLNTCSSEALCELLRHLKRAYWPFSWDTNVDCFASGGRGSTGGFRAAAKAALGSDEMTAALRAVSATAAHRLQRGIWTSPGAGDLNRCVAAAERLVMMVGDEQPQERRDLAVLLLHAGQPSAAAAELAVYLKSMRAARGGAQQHDPFDVRLAQDLWKMLADSGVQPAREVVSVEAVLKRGLTGQEEEGSGYKPLIW